VVIEEGYRLWQVLLYVSIVVRSYLMFIQEKAQYCITKVKTGCDLKHVEVPKLDLLTFIRLISIDLYFFLCIQRQEKQFRVSIRFEKCNECILIFIFNKYGLEFFNQRFHISACPLDLMSTGQSNTVDAFINIFILHRILIFILHLLCDWQCLRDK
jgi:hypothetical protein